MPDKKDNKPTRAQELRLAFHQVFDGPSGRTVLEHLKKKFHFLGTTAFRDNTGSIDALQMALAEGERNVILYILGALEPGKKPARAKTEREG